MQMIMEKIDGGKEVGDAGGAMKRLDQIWSSLRDQQSGSFMLLKHYVYQSTLFLTHCIGSINKMIRVSLFWFDYYRTWFIFFSFSVLDTSLAS